MAGLFIPDNRNMAPRMWVPGTHPTVPVRFDPKMGRHYGNMWLASPHRRGHYWVRPESHLRSNYVDGTAPTIVQNKWGAHADFNGSRRYRYDLNREMTTLGGPVTLFGIAYISSAASETGTIIQLGNHGNKVYRIALSNSNTAYFQVYSGTPNVVLNSAASIITDFVTYRICAVQRTDTDRELWVHDGYSLISNTTSSTSTSAASGTLDNVYVGAIYNNAYSNELNGGIQMAGWARYAWTDAQVLAWLQNPYKDLVPA